MNVILFLFARVYWLIPTFGPDIEYKPSYAYHFEIILW